MIGATLTAQYVMDRAAAFSPLNPPLMSIVEEMLSRIRFCQRSVFTKTSMRAREYLTTMTTLTSSYGSGGRTIDISQLNPPVERIFQVQINGVTINMVDPLDVYAELAPRYYPQSLKLYEVGNDWSSVTGSLNAVVTYCYAPTDISPFGTTAQALSVPDAWVDILVGDLAAYLAHKDAGRPVQDIATARQLSESRLSEFMMYLDHTAGVRSIRLDIPHPTGIPQ